jgi:hypothetical protein
VWKRPKDIAPKPQLFVDGTEEGTVMNGNFLCLVEYSLVYFLTSFGFFFAVVL